MKYYSRKCINYSRDRKITCGNEILLAGIQYYSRKWIITRGKKYYLWARIITRGNLFITRRNDILLAGEKYWQYMAPEGFRSNICIHWAINWLPRVIFIAEIHLLLAEQKYYSGKKYYLRERNITRGNEILLAGTKYYSLERNITRGNEILLSGMKYYSRELI